MAITVGSKYDFSASSSSYCALKRLTDNKVIICWADADDGLDLKACVASISGSNISFGNTVDTNLRALDIGLDRLTNNSAIAAIREDKGENYDTSCIVFTVSGTTLSAGGSQLIDTSSAYEQQIHRINDTQVLVGFRDGTTDIEFYVATISGTTVTPHTMYNFNISSTAIGPKITEISPFNFVIAYTSNGGLQARTLQVDDTAISFGSEITIANNNGSLEYCGLIALDNDHVLVAYADGDNLDNGTIKIGTVSGTSISFGSANVFTGAILDVKPLMHAEVSGVAVFYDDWDDGRSLKVRLGSVSGTTVNFGSGQLIESNSSSYLAPDFIDYPGKQNVAIAFRDNDDGNDGSIRIVNLGTNPPQITESSNLFIAGSEGASINQFCDLFIQTEPIPTGSCNIYTKGIEPVTLIGSWTGEAEFETNGFNYTPDSGPNRIAIIAIIGEGNTNPVANINTVTLGGMTLTAIESDDGIVVGSAGSYHNLLWLGYINESDIISMSGNALNITWDQEPNYADGGETLIQAATYKHVNQNIPIVDSASNTNISASNIQAGSISADNYDRCIYVAVAGNLRNHTAPAGYTEQLELDTIGTGFSSASAERDATTASTENPTATWDSSTRLAIISAVINHVGDPMRFGGIAHLYIYGYETLTGSKHLFLDGHKAFADSDDLFINGYDTIDDIVNLFMPVFNEHNTSGNLIITGHSSTSALVDSIETGHEITDISGDLFVHGHYDVQVSRNLFIWGKDSRYCLNSDDVVFYHPLDNYTEYTLQEVWQENVVDFSGSILGSGAIIGSETIIAYDNQSGGYPSLDNATNLAVAFWAKGFFNSPLRDSSIFIGNSSSAVIQSGGNGIEIRGSTSGVTAIVNGTSGNYGILQPGSCLDVAPDDEDWHFVVIYSEISGGNWHTYGSINGQPLTHLVSHSGLTTPMSGQRYYMISFADLNDASPPLIIDEVICWANLQAPFTDDEVHILHHLGLTGLDTMNNYGQYNPIIHSEQYLYTHGYSPIQTSGDLFAYGHIAVNSTTDLFTVGHILNTAAIDLFIGGSGIIPMSTALDLLINGVQPKPAVACPILDPTASIQIKDSLIGIYQSRIDALINQLGKNCYLEFDPVVEQCPNCEYDTLGKRSRGIYIPGGPRPFKRGRKCPYCKGHGFTKTPVNKCIKCLIQWNPSDAENFGIAISKTKGIVRLKTYLTEAGDLARANTVLVNHDIVDQMQLRVKLLRGPIPVGLREDRYCISFWELI